MAASSLRGNSVGRAAAAAVVFGAAVAIVAIVGSIAAGTSSETYMSLQQPSWAPPSWLFGPVWTVLYVLIAFAGWRFWMTAGSFGRGRTELAIYVIGLVLNGLWTPLFFALGMPVAALVDIIALDVVIIATMVGFARHDRLAGWVLSPYLAWTLFATALNTTIAVLN